MPANDLHSTEQDLHRLLQEESRVLDPPLPGAHSQMVAKSDISTRGLAEEPWLEHARKDRFGLAFSGGGIRSATFNLGVLQGLDRLGLLSKIDYLSTVSGGGYIGGWYGAWLSRPHNWQIHSDEVIDESRLLAGLNQSPETPALKWLKRALRFHQPNASEESSRPSPLWRLPRRRRRPQAFSQASFGSKASSLTLINRLIVSDSTRVSFTDTRGLSEETRRLHHFARQRGRGCQAQFLRHLLQDLAPGAIKPHRSFPQVGRDEGSPPVSDSKQSVSSNDQRDPRSIRHLREFSRFLVPRLGVSNIDMWTALSTIVAGLIPAALTAFSLLVLALSLWLGLASPLARPTTVWWPWFPLITVALFLVGTEIRFRTTRPIDNPSKATLGYGICVVAALVLVWVGTGTAAWTSNLLSESERPFRSTLLPTQLPPPGDAATLGGTFSFEAGIAATSEPRLTVQAEAGPVPPTPTPTTADYRLNLQLFEFAIVLWATQVLFILLRLGFWRVVRWLLASTPLDANPAAPSLVGAIDATSQRVIGRLCALGIAWIVLGALWEIAVYGVTWNRNLAVIAPGGASVTVLSLFALLRKWFAGPTEEAPSQSGERLTGKLRQGLPMLLAYLAVLSTAVFTMSALIAAAQELSLAVANDPSWFDARLWLLVGMVYLNVLTLALTILIVASEYVRDLLPEGTWEQRLQRRRFDPRSLVFASLAVLLTPFLVFNPYLNADYLLAQITNLNPLLDVAHTFRLVLYLAASFSAAWIIGALFCFDVERVGLHYFYRSRLARAFLGASHPPDLETASPDPNRNRQTEERLADDLPFRELVGQRPHHLICCAANDLGTDRIATLYRGARSATLSPHGISLLGYFRRVQELKLSSAMTASAAAFNSVMGSKSIALGYPVSLLLAALNLRLGLWMPHPLSQRSHDQRFPGWLFFKELFWQTRAGTRTVRRQGKDQLVPSGHSVHLSDGGHFENLALYELVRRHCRYIILSDVGADPNYEFSDLGNAVRRIREDFGVEVELSLGPLRPNKEGLTAQHVIVGTIHYDGKEGIDKGTIVYLKPAFTGDEPIDIEQYRERSPDFPHESTVDQFYDEAQWEAYRGLGYHTVLEAFHFLEHSKPQKRKADSQNASYLFQRLRQFWYPTPDNFSQSFLDLTARFADLESEVREHAPQALQREFFPELVSEPDRERSVPPTAREEDGLLTIQMLMKVCQVLEDVWLGCQLDSYWNHPLNNGWLNYFHRWAATESFRTYWPSLAYLFNPRFGRFMQHHFQLESIDRPQDPDRFRVEFCSKSRLERNHWPRWMFTPRVPRRGLGSHERDIVLFFKFQSRTRVPLAAIRMETEPGTRWGSAKVVRWTVPGLRRAPGFRDAELTVFFFERVLKALETKLKDCQQFEVRFAATPEIEADDTQAKRNRDMSPARKADQVATLRRLGFELQKDTDRGARTERVMIRVVKPPRPAASTASKRKKKA